MTPFPLPDVAQQERARREILQKSDLIKPLPELVVRILGMLNDSRTVPADIERQLRVDPVLVAKMLGMVNSPFYGLSRAIESVKEAVMVIGFRGLRSLLLVSTTAKYLNHDFRCYGHARHGLLEHSFAVACASRALAQLVGQTPETAEETFIAGLLHDIGKMLTASYWKKPPMTPEQHRGDSVRAELDALGFDHTECGALVAAKWNLSPTVQELLKCHHDRTPHGTLEPQLAILRLVEELAHARGIGYLPEFARAEQPLEREMRTLGLSGERWKSARKALDEAIEQALATTRTVLA